MSDRQGWVAPGAAEDPGPTPASPWSAPSGPAVPPSPPDAVPSGAVPPDAVPPGAVPSGAAVPAWGPGTPPTPWGPGVQPGWTPPPKPGLVPLRPMTLGTILGAMFQVMRRNPLPTFGLSLLLSLVGGVISVGLVGLTVWVFASSTPTFSTSDSGAAIVAALVAAIAAVLAIVAVNLVVSSIVQGIVILEVSRGTLGERLRLAGLWHRLRPRLGRLIGWLALQSVVIVLAFALLVLLIAALGSLGTGGIAAAVLLGILGGLGLAVLAAWLLVKLAFTVPGIVLERRGVLAAVRRSWALTRGYYWRTLGILLLVIVIYWVAGQVVSIPVSFVAGIAGSLSTGGSTDPTSAIVTVVVIYGLSALVGTVIGAIGTVMLSATVGLLYIDTRMRKEGLDQDLIRAAESRAAGTDQPDPYAADAGAP